MTRIPFTKMHGCGNDYIYVNAMLHPIKDPAAAARLWSDRHKGIGSDGLVLIDRSPVPEADFSMRIFNADGSEAMMCGNASRCIGKYLYERGITTQTQIRLLTLSGVKVLELHVSGSAVVTDPTPNPSPTGVGNTAALSSPTGAGNTAALPSLQGEGSGVGSVTRSATDITELCSRLNIALFDADGTKVKTVAQKEGDANYGTVGLSLAAGTYRLVVIAHNGEGSATITSEEKVTFPNNKVTDTFYYYGDLVVTSEKQSYDLTLTRAVAMFRLVLTDESIPATVAKMKFYYLGGSSTFSPKDGYGCVNSKQTEIRPMADDGIYEIYTLPHTEDDVLTKLTVTALDANDNIIKETVFEDIPVTRNQVTRYTGSFFGNSGGESGSGDFRMNADPDWDAVNSFTF